MEDLVIGENGQTRRFPHEATCDPSDREMDQGFRFSQQIGEAVALRGALGIDEDLEPLVLESSYRLDQCVELAENRRMFQRAKRLHLVLVVVLCLGAGPALADEVTDQPVAELGAAPEPTYAPPRADATGDFESAEAEWEDRRPWRYGTGHFFGLSRGMEDAGVPRLARPFLYVLTVPFDTVHLPVAAISGLFGD